MAWQSWPKPFAACLALVGVVFVANLSHTSVKQAGTESPAELLQNAGALNGYYQPSGWNYLPTTSPYTGSYGQSAYPGQVHRSGYVHPAGWSNAVVDAHARADEERHNRFSIGGITKRVMHPLESVNHEPKHEEVDHSEVEQIWQGMEPLEKAIAQMQSEITGQQNEIAQLESMIHGLKEEHEPAAHASPAAPTSAAQGGKFSFSIPGPIEIGHLSLPGGAYTIDMGGVEDGEPSPEAASLRPSSASEDAQKTSVLDSRTEMDTGVDHHAVKHAAQALQKKLVAELEAAKKAADARAEGKGLREGQARAQVAANRNGDVLTSAVDMDNGVDHAAVKKAAQGFLERMVREHEDQAMRADRKEQADERTGEVEEARRMLKRDERAAALARVHLKALERAGKGRDGRAAVQREGRHVAEDRALLKELGAKA